VLFLTSRWAYCGPWIVAGYRGRGTAYDQACAELKESAQG